MNFNQHSFQSLIWRNMQKLVANAERKAFETETELINSRKESEERLQKALEAETRMDKVQETLLRWVLTVI